MTFVLHKILLALVAFIIPNWLNKNNSKSTYEVRFLLFLEVGVFCDIFHR